MNKVLTESQVVAFFDKLCLEIAETEHSAESKTFYSSYEEACSAESNRAGKRLYIAFDGINGRISSKGDSNYDFKTISFFVLKPANPEDYSTHRVIRDNCLDIAMRIIERMNMYRHKWDFLQKFDMNTVRYNQVNGSMDNSIGYKIEMEVASPRQFKNILD